MLTTVQDNARTMVLAKTKSTTTVVIVHPVSRDRFVINPQIFVNQIPVNLVGFAEALRLATSVSVQQVTEALTVN